MKLALAVALVAVLGAAHAAHHAMEHGTWDVTMTLVSDNDLCNEAGINAVVDSMDGSGSGSDMSGSHSDGEDGEHMEPPITITGFTITDNANGVTIVLHFSGLGAFYEALSATLAWGLCPDDGEDSNCAPMPNPADPANAAALGMFAGIGAVMTATCPNEAGDEPGLVDWDISTFAGDDDQNDADGSDDASDDGEDGETTTGAASVAASAVVALAAAVAVSKAQL